MSDKTSRNSPPTNHRLSQDSRFMGIALEQAGQAMDSGDVPVGAVVVCNGKVVAAAHNERQKHADPTAHAEVLALRRAARALGRWNLSDCDLYVTLEPCVMCTGAVVAARIQRLVFGALDPKAGAVRSRYALAEDPRMNHRTAVVAGIRSEESGRLLRRFFESLRGK